MATRTSSTAPAGLTTAGVVDAAIALADAHGIDAVSMRRVAQELGVDAMSLYRHVGTKHGLLEKMADAVVTQIAPPPRSGDWVADAHALMRAARSTLLAHPWTTPLIKGRATPTPAALVHLDRLLDILRSGGLSLDLTHHALHVLGSRVLGFSDDLFDDSAASSPPPPEAAAMQAAMMAALPRIAEMAAAGATQTHDGALGGCDDQEEFDFSVELILAGLERRRARESSDA
ncbi:TetR/AcrR family transcriptional regulator [Agrococcus beijingensis]|uniref:TetR/AcrR family transcriptional regulator n=1 Tax=Agrococcus beijingensis TaxID=3068634 RepID=UPI00274032A0|nr:TetR/AcrR family transcriptional regulator [Agrococcus sp. REN33]